MLDLLLTTTGEVDSLPQSPVEVADIDAEEAEAVLRASIRTSILTGAFSDGRMIGMCIISPMREVRRKHLAQMYLVVRKEFWNRGISTHLAEYAIDMATEKGVRKITASISDSNGPGKDFLKSLGFRSEGRDERMLFVDGSFIDGERFALLID